MSSPDGFDHVDFGKPPLTSSASAPSGIDLGTFSPSVANRSLRHACSDDSKAGVSGVSEAYRDSARGHDYKDGLTEEVRACGSESRSCSASFDWYNVDLIEFKRFLSRQAWAQEYYDEDNGFHVALADCSKKEEAERAVKEQNFSIPVIFVSPSGSTYEQCSDIRPGDRLEDSNRNQLGIYSGSIGSSPSLIYGLTAAHTIQDEVHAENEDIKLVNQNIIVSRSYHVFKEVQRNEDERITADIRLLYLEDGVHSRNEIRVEKNLDSVPTGIYVPTVYQCGVHTLRKREIVLRNRRRTLILGVISNFSYTNVGEKLFNVITIVNCQDGAVSVSEPGDCGALAWLVPPANSKYAEVIGIVIGRLKSNLSKGVINNLEDALRFCGLFGTNPCCANFYEST